jgi:hypothetical protein
LRRWSVQGAPSGTTWSKEISKNNTSTSHTHTTTHLPILSTAPTIHNTTFFLSLVCHHTHSSARAHARGWPSKRMLKRDARTVLAHTAPLRAAEILEREREHAAYTNINSLPQRRHKHAALCLCSGPQIPSQRNATPHTSHIQINIRTSTRSNLHNISTSPHLTTSKLTVTNSTTRQ